MIKVLLLLLISSCTFLNSGMKSRAIEDYYASTGVVKYFLADIPSWANFDQKAGCYRSNTIRYLNIDALMKSYNLNFSNAIQIQATFSDELAKLTSLNLNKTMNLKDEELLFYKVSETVAGNILFFDPPVFKKINLIYLDEVLNDPKKEKKLTDFLNSKIMDTGVPVLISFCLTRKDIESRYPNYHFKMISAELFSIYNSNGLAAPYLKFDLAQFFKPNQNLYFYSQKTFGHLEEILGSYKILNY
jgi:hypothetical protein